MSDDDNAREMADPPPAVGPAPKAAPRGRRAASPPSSSTDPKAGAGRPSNHDARAKKVARLHAQYATAAQMAGTLTSRRLSHIGAVVNDQADKIGEAWATAADSSPSIAKLIDNAASGGSLMLVLMAYWPVVRAAVGPLPKPDPSDPDQIGFDTIREALADVTSLFKFGGRPVPPVRPPAPAAAQPAPYMPGAGDEHT